MTDSAQATDGISTTDSETAVERAPISLRSVSVSFDDEQVLRGVDFDVAEDELCVLVGPSGCGKSTTLKCIAGLQEYDGEIALRGVDASDLRVEDRNIGYVFQEFEETLFPHMTVAENVAFGLDQQDAERTADERSAAVTEVLEMLSLAHARDSYPGSLSGGQQQRVELARQLVRECEVMLLDDPLGDLDYKLQKYVEDRLRRLHADLGGTFLYVTHDQEEAFGLADKLVVMNRGCIEQVGAPTAVYDEPATAFVARFVGDSNLVSGTVRESGNGRVTVETSVGDVAATGDAESGERVVVVVRPEDVVIGADAARVDTQLDGELHSRTFSGEETEFQVKVGDGDFLQVTVPGNVGRDEEAMTVGWDASTTHVFGADDLSVAADVDFADIERMD